MRIAFSDAEFIEVFIMSIHHLVPITILGLGVLGCASQSERMRDSEHARIESERKVAAERWDAQQNSAATQQDATQGTPDQTGAMQPDAEEEFGAIEDESADADAGADEPIAGYELASETTDTLAEDRDSVRLDAKERLDAIDKQIVELRVKLEAKQSPVAADRVILDLRNRSESVRRRNEAELDTATPATFDAVKRAVDARLMELEKAIAEAGNRG